MADYTILRKICGYGRTHVLGEWYSVIISSVEMIPSSGETSFQQLCPNSTFISLSVSQPTESSGYSNMLYLVCSLCLFMLWSVLGPYVELISNTFEMFRFSLLCQNNTHLILILIFLNRLSKMLTQVKVSFVCREIINWRKLEIANSFSFLSPYYLSPLLFPPPYLSPLLLFLSLSSTPFFLLATHSSYPPLPLLFIHFHSNPSF